MGGCEGGNLEVLWGAAGAIAQNLPAEKGQALVGAAVGGLEAMLEPPCSQEGFLTSQTSTGDSPAFPALFANAASELPPWHTVFSLCCPAHGQKCFRSYPALIVLLSSLFLHSVAPSHVPRVCLGHSSTSCCSGGRFGSLRNEIQKCEFCAY